MPILPLANRLMRWRDSISLNRDRPMVNDEVSLAARYQRLEEQRRPFLERARECARYTLPFLMPPEGHTKDTHFKTPWQGVGARGVNNLASKLLLTLLPPNSPFFRLVLH